MSCTLVPVRIQCASWIMVAVSPDKHSQDLQRVATYYNRPWYRKHGTISVDQQFKSMHLSEKPICGMVRTSLALLYPRKTILLTIITAVDTINGYERTVLTRSRYLSLRSADALCCLLWYGWQSNPKRLALFTFCSSSLLLLPVTCICVLGADSRYGKYYGLY